MKVKLETFEIKLKKNLCVRVTINDSRIFAYYHSNKLISDCFLLNHNVPNAVLQLIFLFEEPFTRRICQVVKRF